MTAKLLGRDSPAVSIGLRNVGAATAISLLLILTGCNSSAKRLKEEGFTERNPVGIPDDASLVRHQAAHDSGLLNPDTWFGVDDVTFKPAHAGQVWVVDEQSAAIVYKALLRPGDELRVSPKENVIQLNKAYVYGRKLPDEHGFLIYYAPSPDTTAPATTESAPLSPSGKPASEN